jgi:hypothetical protein
LVSFRKMVSHPRAWGYFDRGRNHSRADELTHIDERKGQRLRQPLPFSFFSFWGKG